MKLSSNPDSAAIFIPTPYDSPEHMGKFFLGQGSIQWRAVTGVFKWQTRAYHTSKLHQRDLLCAQPWLRPRDLKKEGLSSRSSPITHLLCDRGHAG